MAASNIHTRQFEEGYEFKGKAGDSRAVAGLLGRAWPGGIPLRERRRRRRLWTVSCAASDRG